MTQDQHSHEHHEQADAATAAGSASHVVDTSTGAPADLPGMRKTGAAFPRRIRPGVVAALLALLIASCGNDTAAGDTGIPPQDPQLVAEGAELYAATCAECHGSDLRGTDLGPSHLSRVYEPSHHADIAFLLAVQRGSPAHHWPFGDMEPVAGLTPEDVAAIVAFVRETQRLEGFEPYPP